MAKHCIFIGAPVGKFPSTYHFLPLSQELARRGHQVVLLVAHRRVEMADPDGNPAIHIWPSDRPTRWRDAWFLYRLLRRYRPDCLVGNFAAVNIMMVLGWLTGVPQRVAWYHTMSAAIDLDNHLPAWRIKLLRWRKRFVYRLCTYIVPASHAAAEDLGRVYGVAPSKMRVFRNSLADPLPAGSGPGPVPETPRVVCVGRLYPTKGQDVLLRAIPLVAAQHPTAVFEFIGDGPSAEQYRALARELGVAERCVFAGNTSHREVLDRLRAATLAVLPSRSDNCPLAAIEALAMGVPVIGANVGGIPEIIHDGTDGFVFPPGDSAALAAHLNRVLAEPALRRDLRAQARRSFLARFEQRPALRAQAEWVETLLRAVRSRAVVLAPQPMPRSLAATALRQVAEWARK